MRKSLKKMAILGALLAIVVSSGAYAKDLHSHLKSDKFQKQCNKELYTGIIMGASKKSSKALSAAEKSKFKTIAKGICSCTSEKLKSPDIAKLSEKQLNKKTMAFIQACTKSQIAQLKNNTQS